MASLQIGAAPYAGRRRVTGDLRPAIPCRSCIATPAAMQPSDARRRPAGPFPRPAA
jgi:hypothetical protein